MKDVLKLALEALETADEIEFWNKRKEALTAIKEALALPEQEPVAVKHMLQWIERLKSLSNHGQYLNIPGLGAGACWELANELEQFIKTAAQPAQGATDIAALVEGMKVSVDVSTSELDAGHRLFGTVTLAQENQGCKHGLILLVQDPEANFKLPLPAQPVEKPMHPQIQKMYEDYFDKCFKESSALDAAVLAEREACAVLAQQTICDTHTPTGINIYGTRAAKAIRARGNT